MRCWTYWPSNNATLLRFWESGSWRSNRNGKMQFLNFIHLVFSCLVLQSRYLFGMRTENNLNLKTKSFCVHPFSLAPFQPSIHSKTDRYQIWNNRRRTIKLLACCTLRSRKGKEKILEVQPTRKKLQNSTIKALFPSKLGNNLNCATSVRFNFAVKCVFFSSEVAGYYRSISHQTSPAW